MPIFVEGAPRNLIKTAFNLPDGQTWPTTLDYQIKDYLISQYQRIKNPFEANKIISGKSYQRKISPSSKTGFVGISKPVKISPEFPISILKNSKTTSSEIYKLFQSEVQSQKSLMQNTIPYKFLMDLRVQIKILSGNLNVAMNPNFQFHSDKNLHNSLKASWFQRLATFLRITIQSINRMKVTLSFGGYGRQQYPIWNDLVEASNGWADGFTDALSNIVDGVDSVTESLDQLQKQILKDTLKVIIKRTVTDNLQDMLGDEGSIFGFKGLFGGGKDKKKEAQEIMAKKPLPVYITNPAGIEEIQSVMGDSTDNVKQMMGNAGSPIPVFVTNMVSGGGMGGENIGAAIAGLGSGTAEEGVSSVSQDLADISAEIAANTEEASASSDSWLSSIKSGFSDIGSWISGLFNSGGGATAGGGGSSTGSSLMSLGMMAASAYSGGAMADGGIISEPIIGKGLKSGQVYNFGENTKYGVFSFMSSLRKQGSINSR